MILLTAENTPTKGGEASGGESATVAVKVAQAFPWVSNVRDPTARMVIAAPVAPRLPQAAEQENCDP